MLRKTNFIALVLFVLIPINAWAVDKLDATRPKNSDPVSSLGSYERATRTKINEMIDAYAIGPSVGDMFRSVYDTDRDGIVDKAESVSDGTNTKTAAEVKAHIDSTSNPHYTTSTQILPSQGGNANKVLGTDGTSCSWVNQTTSENSIFQLDTTGYSGPNQPIANTPNIKVIEGSSTSLFGAEWFNSSINFYLNGLHNPRKTALYIESVNVTDTSAPRVNSGILINHLSRQDNGYEASGIASVEQGDGNAGTFIRRYPNTVPFEGFTPGDSRSAGFALEVNNQHKNGTSLIVGSGSAAGDKLGAGVSIGVGVGAREGETYWAEGIRIYPMISDTHLGDKLGIMVRSQPDDLDGVDAAKTSFKVSMSGTGYINKLGVGSSVMSSTLTSTLTVSGSAPVVELNNPITGSAVQIAFNSGSNRTTTSTVSDIGGEITLSSVASGVTINSPLTTPLTLNNNNATSSKIKYTNNGVSSWVEGSTWNSDNMAYNFEIFNIGYGPAITIDKTNSTVGLINQTPKFGLDVNGQVRLTGSNAIYFGGLVTNTSVNSNIYDSGGYLGINASGGISLTNVVSRTTINSPQTTVLVLNNTNSTNSKLGYMVSNVLTWTAGANTHDSAAYDYEIFNVGLGPAVTIKKANSYVGLYNQHPSYTLDVNGQVRLLGSNQLLLGGAEGDTSPTSSIYNTSSYLNIDTSETNGIRMNNVLYAETNKRVACGGGSTGSTTSATGTVTLYINGSQYYLLRTNAP